MIENVIDQHEHDDDDAVTIIMMDNIMMIMMMIMMISMALYILMRTMRSNYLSIMMQIDILYLVEILLAG